ncbi:hypothetical protein THAOC_19658, partial [Thalassiosira oceanica]
KEERKKKKEGRKKEKRKKKKEKEEEKERGERGKEEKERQGSSKALSHYYGTVFNKAAAGCCLNLKAVICCNFVAKKDPWH